MNCDTGGLGSFRPVDGGPRRIGEGRDATGFAYFVPASPSGSCSARDYSREGNPGDDAVSIAVSGGWKAENAAKLACLP